MFFRFSRKVVLSTFVLFLSISAFAKDSFFQSYNASKEALGILEENSPDLKIIKKAKDYILIPENYSAGFIFYPGGKVECEAYLPLVKAIAEKGFYTILVHMPSDLAIFDVNAASKYLTGNPEIKHWIIGGHSLGGAMAGSFVSKHKGKIEGIVFMGAFSTAKIGENVKTLCIYGSCDKVLNLKSYDKNKRNLPANVMEIVIEGGCHSYFGDYGHQDGDGNPAITRENQILCTADAISNYFLVLNNIVK